MVSLLPLKESLNEGLTWRAAKLDTHEEFHPQWHCRHLPEMLQWYHKFLNMLKGSTAGLNMVLEAYVVFSYCLFVVVVVVVVG